VAGLAPTNFSIAGGQVLALLGPNGAGKSTLLKGLLGTLRLDEGEVLVNGRTTSVNDRVYQQMAYGILDDFAWFPELTVIDHLAMLADREAGERALATFGMAQFSDRTAWSLSSGQARRAALCTMLLHPWSILLLDEPEQRLDQHGLELLASTINDSIRDRDRVVVVATHSPRLVSLLNRCTTVDLTP